MFNEFNSTNPYGWGGFGQATNSNVYKVTGLEEAIMRTTLRGSEMVFFNQNKDEFYIVRVDMNGNKSWQTFTYALPDPNAGVPVSKSEFDAFVTRFTELESKLKEASNESNG